MGMVTERRPEGMSMAEVQALFDGHAAFVDEEYEKAQQHYTHAIELDPQNPDAYAKRAAAFLKTGNHTEAISDADKSLNLQPTAKAYKRKGLACFALQEFKAARIAFKHALELGHNATREL